LLVADLSFPSRPKMLTFVWLFIIPGIQNMNGLTIISESINVLFDLSKKEIIFLEDLQKEFRPDLQSFIVGETLSMRDGKLAIGKNLYKKWLTKLRTRGFDYEIDFKR
jgi:hypothetical protein